MGDEMAARRELFYYRDPSNPIEVVSWMKDYLAAGQPAHVRARHLLAFALHGKADMREGFRSTCEVAARLAQRPRALLADLACGWIAPSILATAFHRIMIP